MRDLPPLNAIRVFEAAARHENFSRAAEELNVTQSAVSRQIQQLEQQLSARLFARNGPRLRLTNTGRAYQAIVQDGLSTIRRGTHRLFAAQATPSITISTVPSLVSRWLVPRLVDFEQAHPDITLQLSAISLQSIDFAIATHVDAAIRYGEGHWPELHTELLVEETLFPVCSPEIAKRLTEPADLARHRLFAEDPNWDLWSHWLEAVGETALPNAGDRLSEDYNIQLQAAALGHGVALGRGLLTADDLRAGRLVCPFHVSARSPVQYYFVCPHERLDEPVIAQTLQWLKRAAEQTVDGLEQWCGPRVESEPSIDP